MLSFIYNEPTRTIAGLGSMDATRIAAYADQLGPMVGNFQDGAAKEFLKRIPDCADRAAIVAVTKLRYAYPGTLDRLLASANQEAPCPGSATAPTTSSSSRRRWVPWAIGGVTAGGLLLFAIVHGR